MPEGRYFPSLTIRQSECEALRRLAEPTKDLLFPIFRAQAWPNPKKSTGGPIERSTDHLVEAFGTRMVGIDLARPIDLTSKDYKTDARREWALLGRAEVTALHNPENGFEAWCNFIENGAQRVAVAQWTDDPQSLQLQIERLASLGRGLILRFRRSKGWNLAQVAGLSGMSFGNIPLLLIYDYEQISANDDLTAVAASVQGIVISINNILKGGKRDHVLKASSFPSEFTSIGEEYACLPIRERQLHGLLHKSPPLLNLGIALSYGDHAAVYASDRLPAFRGVPRVDYATPGEWIYHRRREGFQRAAEYVHKDPKWDNDNLCWGAQRIREAASGNIEGLNAPGRWTTIRINTHMHVQAHSAGNTLSTDEDWID